VNWPQEISSLLAQVSLVNFNWNFMFFGCYDERPKFIENWIAFMLLPVFYAVFFMSRHYIYKSLKINPETGFVCCTFCGSTRSAFFGGVDWYMAAKSSLFMGNLLYLATLAKSLAVFACEQLPDGTYYMVGAPGVVCYEGDHVKLMVLASIAMVVYSIGWPLFLFFAFRISSRKFLLYNANFKGLLGFLYTRFELDRFWWHMVIVTHKLVMVMIKTFIFNSFYQCPLALTFTFFLMGAQAYAQPYASNVLDKLQSCAYTAQFIFLFFGLLFATEKGSNDLNELLTYGFFGTFFLMGAACTFVMYNDLRR